MIGSTANYIANGLKWRRGEPWLQEVRVPQNLPWDQADLTIKHPRSKWGQFGVSYPDGKALPSDDLPASLLLPMGRMGPAFLAYFEFRRLHRLNNSLIYSTTAGYLATRIAGAPPMRQPSSPVAQLPFNELRELQQLLVPRGIQCRQGRRHHGAAEPHRGQDHADQVRPARGFMADGRIAGADARMTTRGTGGDGVAQTSHVDDFKLKIRPSETLGRAIRLRVNLIGT